MDQSPELVPRPEQAPPASTFPLYDVFFNDIELRAGWRFFMFYITLKVARLGAAFLVRYAQRAPSANQHVGAFGPGPFIISDGVSFMVLLGVSALMARFENRKLGQYGLPFRLAFRGDFWLGGLWGFGAVSVLLLTLRADHNFSYGAPELSGWSIVRFASLWAVAFLAVGLYEEFYLRGYAQFTLTTGISFWPAAFLLSFFFAALHLGNPGETKFGLFQIVLIGLFFCFTLWRTGTLWFAVGFHAAWDWAQSFFYGTPDSGIVAQGHLLHSSFAGPDWLTGGTVGPEGSVLVAPLLVLLCVLFYFAFPNRAP
jgi:membrane protease YdiL (CAAX protease family)